MKEILVGDKPLIERIGHIECLTTERDYLPEKNTKLKKEDRKFEAQLRMLAEKKSIKEVMKRMVVS